MFLIFFFFFGAPLTDQKGQIITIKPTERSEERTATNDPAKGRLYGEM